MSAHGGRPARAARSGRWVSRALAGLIGVYQRIPHGSAPRCRFAPTCSSYAREALLTHGALRGGWLVLRRLLRCHPFHAGGLDPVPARPPGRPVRRCRPAGPPTAAQGGAR